MNTPIVKGIVKKGEYFDSVSLMMVAHKINRMEGVIYSAAVMGTEEKKAILEASGFLVEAFRGAEDTDLLIAVKTESEAIARTVLENIDEEFKKLRKRGDIDMRSLPRDLEGGLKILPSANLCLVSVPGQYAAVEAEKALKMGLHTMIFSDNVPLEAEIALKKYARENRLLLMGPDCGTAVINGIPLGFANVVDRGSIGIVAASGTGLQEVCAILSDRGEGISQAIGTGGRDTRKEVGGIMFLEALRALAGDKETRVILLLSKPPHQHVLEKILKELTKIKKPAVASFLGAPPEAMKKIGAIPAVTLEEAAQQALSLVGGEAFEKFQESNKERSKKIGELARKEANRKAKGQAYLCGLFSGGTLCSEAQLVFKNLAGEVYSNIPLVPGFGLEERGDRIGGRHRMIDLGDDRFTVDRPHPMIDFSLRNRRILEEARNPEVAVILFDVVLGCGAHPAPAEELAPVIREAQKLSPRLTFVCSVTGTRGDPQNRERVKETLEQAGVRVMPSNAAAAELAAAIIKAVKPRIPGS